MKIVLEYHTRRRGRARWCVGLEDRRENGILQFLQHSLMGKRKGDWTEVGVYLYNNDENHVSLAGCLHFSFVMDVLAWSHRHQYAVSR